MNRIAIISPDVPQICSVIEQFGFKLIYTESVDGFISYEQKHADMQCLVAEDKVFVLSQCRNLGNKLNEYGFDVIYTSKTASGKYPENILLNTKIIGKTAIDKVDSLDINVLKYLKNSGYRIINVNQGYSACSCVKVSDNAIITADNSIYNAVRNTDIAVLKISEGNIILHGAGENTYGFIGGASVLIDENNLLFFGDIEKHPDFDRIEKFCGERSVKIHSLSNIPLTDIGGVILLNISQ